MATRQQKELVEQINALASKLQVEAPKTDGASEQELQRELDRLKAQETARTQQQPGGQQQPGATTQQQPGGAPPPQGTQPPGGGTAAGGTQHRVGDASTTAASIPEGGRTGTSADGSTTTKTDTNQLLPAGGENEGGGGSSYRIASGRSLTGTGRGQLNAGEEITAADLPGGEQRLQELVKAGIIEQGPARPVETFRQPGPGGEPVAPAGGQTTDPNVQQTNQPGIEPKS